MALTKEMWEDSKQANIDLILKGKLQKVMAERMIKLCEEKIAEFPKEDE